MSLLGKFRVFVRPFTLLVPAIGMVSGALIALGAEPRWASDWTDRPENIWWRIGLGALMAATLNAASNGINQIYDIEVDRINKPARLLPAGLMTLREAWTIVLACFALAWLQAWWISRDCFWLVLAASFLTTIYSAPPLRTKRHGFWANITIAIPRGTLLCVAGWSCVKNVERLEPWWIGAVYGLYFLGAVTTKDFSDLEGDRLNGCRTLPVIFGVRKTVYLIAPFFVFPFLLIPIGVFAGVLTGNSTGLLLVGMVLPVWGAYIAYLLLKKPEELGGTENHVSWKHMYLLTLFAQVGFAVCYLL